MASLFGDPVQRQPLVEVYDFSLVEMLTQTNEIVYNLTTTNTFDGKYLFSVNLGVWRNDLAANVGTYFNVDMLFEGDDDSSRLETTTIINFDNQNGFNQYRTNSMSFIRTVNLSKVDFNFEFRHNSVVAGTPPNVKISILAVPIN